MSAILEKACLVITDVDGVLTDGGMYYSTEGEEYRKFSVYDGGGVVLLRKAHIPLVVMTGETGPCIQNRCAKLRITDYRLGVKDKSHELDHVTNRYGVPAASTVFIGDFINDLGVMRRVGLPACPANACAEIKALSLFTTHARGGNGVLWEIASEILRAKNMYEQILADYTDCLH